MGFPSSGRSGFALMGYAGIKRAMRVELTTSTLATLRSTTELRPRLQQQDYHSFAGLLVKGFRSLLIGSSTDLSASAGVLFVFLAMRLGRPYHVPFGFPAGRRRQ
jgi:hypothetical protein